MADLVNANLGTAEIGQAPVENGPTRGPSDVTIMSPG